MTEEERRAEEERARKALQEQQQAALGGLGGFMEFILEMIKGFFAFLQNAVSGNEVGDGDGRELEQPGGRESLFNGIKASGSAAVAWAKFQKEHQGERVNHGSPVAGKASVGDDRHMREKHPITGDRRMHHGIDITGASGIVASEKGIVLFSGTLRGFGNAVIVGHADGGYTVYGHLASINAPAPGQEIGKGEAIGVMGMTGGATGVHLHYEQRKGSESVVPVINGRQISRGTPLEALPSLASVGVTSGNGSSFRPFAAVRTTEIGARG
jgi:murein DD-endopeptidase MepM/ murein hydrolase activator NlpD